MATRRSNEPRRGQTPAAVGAVESAETTAKEPSPSTRKRVQPKKTAVPPAGVTVSADVRRGMIAEAAYLRAERRGFAPGHEEEDWLAAEKEVDAQLAFGQVWGVPQ